MPGDFGVINTSPNFNVPSGVPGRNNLRQFGSVAQVLAANNVPILGAVNGLGTGGGASIQIGETQGDFGYIEVMAGSNPSTGGSVIMVFPSTPPTLFLAGSPDAFGTISQVTAGNYVAVSWTGKPQASKRDRIAYQWATSK